MKSIDIGAITAYSDAKKAGFQGTYSDFCATMAQLSASSTISGYPDLIGKPRINGIELVGNLTSEDLKIYTRGSRMVVVTESPQFYGQKVTLTDGNTTREEDFDNNGVAVFEGVVMTGIYVASCTYNNRTAYAYVKAPYFGNYTARLVYPESDIYSVLIDHSGDGVDDAAMCTYMGSASGMTPCSDDWWLNEPFSLLKPCFFVDGVVDGYLDPDDMDKKLDGSEVDKSNVTIVGAGSVPYTANRMLEISRMGIKADWQDENKLLISITTGENVTGFDYGAFKYGDKSIEKIYLGMKSLSYGSAGTSYYSTGTSFGSYIRDDRTNYEKMGYKQFELLQFLAILFHKRLRIGELYNDNSVFPQTGMCCRSANGEITVLGMSQLISNFTIYPTKSAGVGNVLKSYDYVPSESGGNYPIESDSEVLERISGNMKKPIGVVGKTFLPKETGENSTTYYGINNSNVASANNIGTWYYGAGGNNSLFSNSWLSTATQKSTMINNKTTYYNSSNAGYMRQMYFKEA